jgi:hypothetical protein
MPGEGAHGRRMATCACNVIGLEGMPLMNNRAQWLWSVCLLASAGAVTQGCKSSHHSSPVVDGGAADSSDGTDGDARVPGSVEIVVSGASGLSTSESGGKATFSVALGAQPSANVTIDVSSDNRAEGDVSPTQLVFTPDNWDAKQEVVVTGIDDDAEDGPVEYHVVIASATSEDPLYNGLDADDVTVTNVDNDTAGVSVASATGLQTSEAGAAARFTVVLNSAPSANVTFALTSSDDGEGTVSPASLTFSPDNWNAAQTVTITGVDDADVDGAQSYTISIAPAVSDDDAYAGLSVDAVSVSNADNEVAGFVIAPTSGLRTSELGSQDAFTVSLSAKPTSDVVLTLSASPDGEVSLSDTTLTFTPQNWRGLQTVTVTGLDDTTADGTRDFTVVTAPAVSSDSAYNGVDPADVTGRNVDNETAGVSLVTPYAVETTESGGQAEFAVTLSSRPTADVTIAIANSAPGEVRKSTDRLVFTPDNWNAPQVVILTGVDDDVADGSQPFTLSFQATSSDAGYQGVTISDLTGANLDNDSPGIRVLNGRDLVVGEGGAQATFSVVLNDRPSGNVTIAVSSDTPSEVTASRPSIEFTPANWNSPQDVVLTGVNDEVIDGDQLVTIRLAPAVSDDANYSNRDADDVVVLNRDNDTAGITVAPDSFVVDEGGAQASVSVVLNARPTADVVLAVSSSDLGEATVSAPSLTFTRDNWNAPQSVTLTGVNDAIEDGNQIVALRIGPAVSTDPNYSNMLVPDTLGGNRDNDTAGIDVIAAPNLTTTEHAAGQATFDVRLRSQPTGNVTIPIASLDATEGTVSPSSLTFTESDWNSPQQVIVTGVNDAVQDGDQPYAVSVGPATSGDAKYNGVSVGNVALSNTDDDTANVVVAAIEPLSVSEGGLRDSFTVVLSSEPTADVTFAVASSDASEGSVSPRSLTFTPTDWSSPKTVYVTGLGDLLQDGDQPFSVRVGPAVSTDGNYNGRTLPNISATNLDLDSPAVSVHVLSNTTSEIGSQATFTLTLTTPPSGTNTVTFPITSLDTSEGTVSPTSVSFDANDYNAIKTVTVTGVQDAVEDGEQTYFVKVGPAVSGDPRYGGRTVPNVRFSNTDDDTAGITVDKASLTTSEGGATDTFSVVLNSEPTSTVTIAVSSSDLAEGVLSTSSLVFTAGDWNAPHTVTVTGQNDDVADGNAPYQVVFGAAVSGDADYNRVATPSIDATNNDNDTAGVIVTPGLSSVTTEAGATATFQVRLQSQPRSAIVIPIVSSNAAEGAVGPASLTFTSANWTVDQTVTVTGVDDHVQDNTQAYYVAVGPVSSGDAVYQALPANQLSFTNTDDDVAGITVTPTSSLGTTEAGGTATFSVVLNTRPTSEVTIAYGTSDGDEVSLSTTALTFAPDNWNVPQVVTLTGVDDRVADGNQPFTLVFASTSSVDPNYDARALPNITGNNADDDTANVLVSTSSISTFELPGGGADFTVVLTSEPTADVVIPVVSTVPAEATADQATLTFNAVNWNVAQTVHVAGVNDRMFDGDKAYVITLGVPTTGDAVYGAINPADVTGLNIEAALSCSEVHDAYTPTPASGVYRLDTDRTGPSAQFSAYCDMTSAGGGWTLLAWAGDTDGATKGVPYPTLAYCAGLACGRGTGVPSDAINALFQTSAELAQGQSTTSGFQIAGFDALASYEYAGRYDYGSLADLQIAPSYVGCTPGAQGTYHDITNTPAADGTIVYLNAGLIGAQEGSVPDYSSDSQPYVWSVGSAGDYCTVDASQPSSYLGTFAAGQYGPGQLSAAGSYSVWIR